MARKFVAEQLIALEPDGPRLIGGRRKADGKIVFPMPAAPESERYEPCGLSREGRLWSFTVQRFQPKTPYRGPLGPSFRPYAVGYVELPGQVIVEARLEARQEELNVGLPMTLTLQAVFHDTEGDEVFTYAFRPLEPTKAAQA